MSVTLALKVWSRLEFAVVLAAGLGLTLPIRAEDGECRTRAQDLFGKLQAKVNDLDSDDKEKFKQRLNSIQADAATLDQLQSQIAAETHKADALEMDYKNAEAEADALSKQFETDTKNADGKLRSIMNRERDICDHSGGDFQENEWQAKCIFSVSCRADDVGACESEAARKTAQFDQEVAPLNSQGRFILNQLRTEKQQADAADASAVSKKHQWEAAKDQFGDQQRDLATRKAEFEQRANRFESDLGSVHQSLIKPKVGPAQHDLWNVFADKDKRCYDFGCGPAPAPPAFPVPEAVSGLPAYQAATKDMDQAVKHAESVRENLRTAERNGATSEELKQLIKDDSKAQETLVILRFKIRSMLDLGGVAPKPAQP